MWIDPEDLNNHEKSAEINSTNKISLEDEILEMCQRVMQQAVKQVLIYLMM